MVRGTVESEWSAEDDHVIQRADGTCLYHLASVVDDVDMAITHVIRAEEHLSNTPRQIFIFEDAGRARSRSSPILPFVAEPGSKNKLSKRKLDKYLKNPDFAELYEHGRRSPTGSVSQCRAETFNPVIVDFYRRSATCPDAILNYLLLLGWSLDDKTEVFTPAEMIEHFSLERVNKAPASFDPKKLVAFQERYMQAAAGQGAPGAACCLSSSRPAGSRARRRGGPGAGPQHRRGGRRSHQGLGRHPGLRRVLRRRRGAGLRREGVRQADPGGGGQHRSSSPSSPPRSRPCRAKPPSTPPRSRRSSPISSPRAVSDLGDIVHAVRVAVTGKPVGFGLFDTLALLGRERVLARLARTLRVLEATPNPPEAS